MVNELRAIRRLAWWSVLRPLHGGLQLRCSSDNADPTMRIRGVAQAILGTFFAVRTELRDVAEQGHVHRLPRTGVFFRVLLVQFCSLVNPIFMEAVCVLTLSDM